ncbi:MULTISPECIES: VanZ family protein [Planomicrobium]|uniref:VanZ family protein n=1 Tax=Planomicrobium okeanokoites TaxID=244 RepID=A0ABV7KMQ8_PLAOK|nr:MULTISPECIES: VanZ family protein [Planomicrobium]PKH08745.1 VanZ family protein [Planomicrobium sp. MB-3u-38]TAA66745.1 VanZ family protein [Planomicrobium okeanokoites]
MHFKIFLVIFWAAGILVVMTTSNAEAFLYNQILHYELDLSPNFIDLFRLNDVALTDNFYLIQKLGHLLSFGILYMLLYNWLHTHSKALWYCIAFAISSEIIQLFFERNGRIFDMGVDFIGILLAYIITVIVTARKTKVQ